MKIDHIVLATDFSEEAMRSFAPLGTLAKMTGARVTLLHALQIRNERPGGGRAGTSLGQVDFEAATKNAEAALEKLAEGLPPEVPTSCRVVTTTNVATSIVKFAREQDADLIAISTHGRTGFRRWVLGSVAAAVLRRSPIPVLCYPLRALDRASRTDIKHVLLTTDLSTDALRPFEPVLEFAKSHQCKVTVLHVLPVLMAVPRGAAFAPPISPPDLAPNLERARTEAEQLCSPLGAGVDLQVEVFGGDQPAAGIVQFASQNDVDLVALSSHGRTGFRRAALGSVAEEVLRKSSVPVLSFHRLEE